MSNGNKRSVKLMVMPMLQELKLCAKEPNCIRLLCSLMVISC